MKEDDICTRFGFKPVKKDGFYDKEQLKKGMTVESEHTNNKKIQKCIAKHHLDESEAYYIELAKLEKKLEKQKKALEKKSKKKMRKTVRSRKNPQRKTTKR